MGVIFQSSYSRKGMLLAWKYCRAFLHMPHHTALVASFGARMSYDAFRDRLRDGLVIEQAGLAELHLPAAIDLALSNSCLEHIDGLEAGLARLAALSAAGSRFRHLVNFGNHRDRRSPFATIYEMPPDAYRRRYGRHINLARLLVVVWLRRTKPASLPL